MWQSTNGFHDLIAHCWLTGTVGWHCSRFPLCLKLIPTYFRVEFSDEVKTHSSETFDAVAFFSNQLHAQSRQINAKSARGTSISNFQTTVLFVLILAELYHKKRKKDTSQYNLNRKIVVLYYKFLFCFITFQYRSISAKSITWGMNVIKLALLLIRCIQRNRHWSLKDVSLKLYNHVYYIMSLIQHYFLCAMFQVWRTVAWLQSKLSSGATTITCRDGDFQFSYFLWFEDSSVCSS